MSKPSLDQLRDIHLPPSPDVWPPATTMGIIVAASLAAALWLTRRHVRRRPLRVALRELKCAAQAHAKSRNGVELARDISGLLRRYTLKRFPDAGTAGLVGSAWLQFLDARGGNGAFVAGIGAVLESLPYRPPHSTPALSDSEAAALSALAQRWLRSNPP